MNERDRWLMLGWGWIGAISMLIVGFGCTSLAEIWHWIIWVGFVPIAVAFLALCKIAVIWKRNEPKDPE